MEFRRESWFDPLSVNYVTRLAGFIVNLESFASVVDIFYK